MRKDDPARLLRLLSLAIAAMLIGVAGLIAFVHLASLRAAEADRQIAENSAPSVIAIEAASAALSRLQIALHERLRGHGLHEATIAAERRAIVEDTNRYLALPLNPGEAEIHAELRHALARMDEVVDRALAVHAGAAPRDPYEMRAELDATAGELDMVLLNAANLNAEFATEAIHTLREVPRRLLPGAVAFELVSAAAAAVAIGAAYRVSRRTRLVLEQKAAELDAFSGRVAHDLLSPLMTVSMALGLVEHRLAGPEDARLRGMIGRAGSSLARVRQLVADLLDFARAGAVPAPGATVAVAPLLGELVTDLEPVAAEAGVDLRLGGASARSVRCAAGILTSVVSNLVQNAIRYAGGAAASVVVRAVDADADVRFEVEDTGPGIAAADQESIFQPYVRRTHEGAGLGLGLATVKRLAESHGGHVGVRSEPGHGALFWVTLPAAPGA